MLPAPSATQAALAFPRALFRLRGHARLETAPVALVAGDAALDVGDVKRQLDWFKAQGLVKTKLGYQDLIATGYADMFDVPK